MSQRERAIHAAAMLSAAAGALAPVADLLARPRKRRRQDSDDDDDDDDRGLALLRRRRRRRREDDDDDDDRKSGAQGNNRDRRSNRDDDDDGDDDHGGNLVSSRQPIVDLDIGGLVQDRIDNALDAIEGGGGGNDDPNIEVAREGDSLIVLTRDIDFASDSRGMEVDTGGISYSSDTLRPGSPSDFTS